MCCVVYPSELFHIVCLHFFFGLFPIWGLHIKFSISRYPVMCFFYLYSFLLDVFSYKITPPQFRSSHLSVSTHFHLPCLSSFDTYRPLSRRLDRCDRVIHNESGDPNGGNMCSFSGATCTSRVCHNADYVPYAKIRFDL